MGARRTRDHLVTLSQRPVVRDPLRLGGLAAAGGAARGLAFAEIAIEGGDFALGPEGEEGPVWRAAAQRRQKWCDRDAGTDAQPLVDGEVVQGQRLAQGVVGRAAP